MNRIRTALLAALLAAVSAMFAGCGGVSGRGSASPASFFLPGLMQVTPKPIPSSPADSVPDEPSSEGASETSEIS